MYGVGRDRVDRRLLQKRGVWATAIGQKEVAGNYTGDVCLTVFTSYKLRKSTLRTEDVVPKWVTLGGTKYPTDVIQLGKLEQLQAGIPTFAHTLADQRTRSTLSGFTYDGQGFHALSCAHSMTGPDEIPFNNQQIEVRDARTRQWLRLGANIRAMYGPGSAQDQNWGFSDAALVEINMPGTEHLISALRQKNPRPVVRMPQSKLEAESLVGNTVTGIGAHTGVITAEVSHTLFRSIQTGRLVDIVIKRPDNGPLTAKGDSGLLWYLQDGTALAMHAVGKIKGRSTVAYMSFSMFLDRLLGLNGLNTQLLEP